MAIFTTTAAVFVGIAHADYQTPSFTACNNPQGSIIANYPRGNHAIAGQDSSESGSDTVYALDTNDNQVTQCYCPATEINGIQTNWLQAGALSAADIQSLENSGWVYIANGATWGLSSGPYLAQNNTYVCNGSGQEASPSSPITATVQSVEVSAPSNSNSNSSSNSNNTPSSSGATLPNTGGSVELFEYIGAGALLLAISFLFKKIAA